MTARPLCPRDYSLHPPSLAPGYKSSLKRAPRAPLLRVSPAAQDQGGPVFTQSDVAAGDSDLISNHAVTGDPVGERIIVHGRVVDENDRPVPRTLVEIWQANAGGRYRHKNDSYLAALDPNFGGCGRAITDENGCYRFHTIKPGAYPWPNGANARRPQHIHFSVFGTAFAQRLITQMYFEGDPLIALCPIVQAIPDHGAIDRLVARLDMDATRPFDSIAYRFDIVLRGQRATRFENRPKGS